MNDKMTEIIYMLAVLASVLIFAFKEQPYLLTATGIFIIVKQLGRINTTLRSK